MNNNNNNNNIDVKTEPAQPVLSIRMRVSVQELPFVIGESYTKIMHYMDKIGQQVAGAPFVAYYNIDMEDLDIEIGFPVAGPLEGTGEIQSSEIPAGTYVSMVYKGAYSGMEKPYAYMAEWIKKSGYKSKGVTYEYYYNSPQEVPESELITRIVQPVE
ncbi:MAG: GyrI-like domain-containing protein [Methanomethylovorans sp.]|uniref:GyrI-like domain-containing protein n=1 Tax=Methanomethylovorans sp. TaxID=2758717 RepID=UPI003C74AD8C